jgi:Zn-dependent peptidase ImmA (M78 family)
VPDDELAVHQLRSAFLTYVEQVHEQHDFETDYRNLAARLGIQVKHGSTNQAVTTDSERLILIAPSAPNRERFTGLHEIAHLLFEEADEGCLRARLKDIFFHQKSIAKTYEESLCDAAAALLLMPRQHLLSALNTHGYSPIAALELVGNCGASLQASMRRVIWSREVPSFAFLLTSRGHVIDSFGHGHTKDYSPGKGFTLEDSHPLRAGGFDSDSAQVFEAPIPFKNGRRQWKMQAQVCCDPQRRILAFFSPIRASKANDGLQPALF